MSEFSEGMAVGQSLGRNDHPRYCYPMNNDGFGNGNGWWILLLLLCGWGNNGWNGNGNNQAV